MCACVHAYMCVCVVRAFSYAGQTHRISQNPVLSSLSDEERTADDSTSSISGKHACGVLCGVKPQPCELKLCTAQVLSRLKEGKKKEKESWQNADQKGREVETAKGKRTWKCWPKASGWDSPGLGNTQKTIPRTNSSKIHCSL